MTTLGSTFEPHHRSGSFRGITVVVVLHLLLGWALLSGTAQKTLALIKKPLEAVVIQEVVIPPPPPPPPAPLQPPREQPKEIPRPQPVAPPVPAPEPQPEAVLPSPVRPVEPVKAAVVEPTKPAPAPVVALPPAPPVDPVKAQAASLEGEYVAKLRALLNSTKRYPTGRQASQQRPQGTVKVWFVLARNGALLEAGVLQSSDSNLLDDAALVSVRRGTYPPFPEHTWPGQESHKFTADMAFMPPS